MTTTRTLALFVGLLAVGTFVFFISPYWTEKLGHQFDSKPDPLPTVGSLEPVTGSVERRHYGEVEFQPLNESGSLFHLDGLKLSEASSAHMLLADYILALSGPALVVLERWMSGDEQSPLVLRLLSGELSVVKEGTPGKVYVIRGDEMTDPKGAVVKPLTTLKISSAVGKKEGLAPPPPTPIALAPPTDSEPSGTLSNDYLDARIAQEQDQFQRCQSNALRDQAEIRGQVLVGLTIVSDGKVADTQIISSTLQDSKLHNCLLQIFKRVTFKPFLGPTIVRSYPISFE